MDLKRLRTFVTVAEEGTVSRAASRLNLTQPALSRQIHELQLELGLQLFDHVGRRLVLTSEGEQLLGESRNLLAHAGALGQRAEFLRRGNEGPLRVAPAPNPTSLSKVGHIPICWHWRKQATASLSFHPLSSRIAMHCGFSASPTRASPFANLSL